MSDTPPMQATRASLATVILTAAITLASLATASWFMLGWLSEKSQTSIVQRSLEAERHGLQN